MHATITDYSDGQRVRQRHTAVNYMETTIVAPVNARYLGRRIELCVSKMSPMQSFE
jgi:hypothetical protein